tara:strand:+ start:340 stop:579 length:240 start_codon:yes stop_codon:yes gene_type:complete
MTNLKSDQIIYSEHGEDECFEYTNGLGRVPDGIAVGYETTAGKVIPAKLVLFKDIQYSQYDHRYWDNLELEKDSNRFII